MWALGLQCGHRTLIAGGQGGAAVGKRREGNPLILLLENQGSSTPLTVQHTLLDTPPPTLTAGACKTSPGVPRSLNSSTIPRSTRALRDPDSHFWFTPVSQSCTHQIRRVFLWYSLWWLTGITSLQNLIVKLCRSASTRQQTSGLPFNEEHRLRSPKDRALNPGSSLS